MCQCVCGKIRNSPPPPPTVTDGGDIMYEHVELRPITGQDKEIAVAPKAAYGTVRR